MLHGIFRILIGLLIVVIMAHTQTGCSSMHHGISIKQNATDKSQWHLSNGNVELAVDATRGRIMSYGFKGGRNVLWTNLDATNPKYDLGGWTNWGGDKIWTWPQSTWGWPPPEPTQAYEVHVAEDGKSLQMVSPVLPKLNVRIVRLIELAENSSTVILTSHLQPVGDPFGKPMAAWEITQIPTAPRLFARIPESSARNRFLGNSTEQIHPHATGGSIVEIRHTDVAGKAFMDADLFAAAYDDLVFLQRLMTTNEAGAWKPDERGQVYFHDTHATTVPANGPSYTELEWTAPIVATARLEQAPVRVIWKLAKPGRPLSDAELAEWLTNLP